MGLRIISIYPGHDANITILDNGEYIILELERYFKERYMELRKKNNREELFKEIMQYIENIYGNNFDYLILPNAKYNDFEYIINNVNYDKLLFADHHKSHACTSFYQSPYNEAICISFDGYGNDGVFNIYQCGSSIDLIDSLDVISMGKMYEYVGLSIGQIDGGNMTTYAGKIMGLSAYGKHNEYFYNLLNTLYKIDGGWKHFINEIKFNEQLSKDLAFTSQQVFEEHFFKYTEKYLKEPIILGGGCALNVILNEKLRKKYKNVFIPPNTNDTGISLGQILQYFPPKEKISITYSGFPILDKEKIIGKETTIEELHNLIKEGNIIGIIQGNSEVGPRALGNRSIVCNPIAGMKDKMNKIKKRESFRPFAPFVRLENANKFFEFDGESEFMSFNPLVREEYREVYPSITHVDGTARLQTVTEKQNKFFYDLVGDGVLMNTSFNTKGRPLITRVEDAYDILEEEELDYVYADGYLISKNELEISRNRNSRILQ